MDDYKNPEKQTLKRPEILTLLCILSFIGSGLAGFSNLLVFLSYDQMGEIIKDFSKDFPDLEKLLTASKKFFLAGFILYSLSLIGALGMWKLRKAGFHFYTGSQLFILFLPIVFIPSLPFSFAGLFLTIGFIAAYATQLKIMT
jgi:hypothetical protein